MSLTTSRRSVLRGFSAALVRRHPIDDGLPEKYRGDLRARISLFFWQFTPSLLWSLSLQSVVLCLDALLFPAIEKHLPKPLARLIRWAWVVVYLITLLASWNISPGAYFFYFREALPFAPISVIAMLVVALVLMVWFGLHERHQAVPASWKYRLFVVGAALLLIKGLAATEIVYMPSVRQYLRSPTLVNIRKTFLAPRNNYSTTAKETPDNTFYALLQQQKTLPSQVVFMLVESWGEKPKALSNIADAIEKQGFQIVKHGFTTYRGSTLSGEFRELCSRYIQPSNDLMDEMNSLKCAPQYMGDKGFQVVGFHGYKKTFYARTTFWTRFGIGNQTFGDELLSQPQCPGPFPGVCDESLIQDGVNVLDAAKTPTFLYMLTLSSHEPVDPAALQTRGTFFNDIPVAHPTQIITRRAISSLIVDLKKRRSQACTLIYVAGDHQPPSASAKGGIFESGKVPYLVFSQNCPETH